MLHTCHGTGTCHAGADGYLCCYFFIGRPLCVQVIFVLYQSFADLRTGSAGICSGYLDACLIGATGDRFISKHDYFFTHYLSPLLYLFLQKDPLEADLLALTGPLQEFPAHYILLYKKISQ